MDTFRRPYHTHVARRLLSPGGRDHHTDTNHLGLPTMANTSALAAAGIQHIDTPGESSEFLVIWFERYAQPDQNRAFLRAKQTDETLEKRLNIMVSVCQFRI